MRHQNLESNFALKIHPLLCREYVKGRDWYDFAWYAAKGIYPNLPYLEAAIRQFGPWSNDKCLKFDEAWLRAKLTLRIAEINWEDAKTDISRFLRPIEAESLQLWSNRFFEAKLTKILEIH